MATSGSKTVAVTSWDNLVFSWSVSSQSVSSNSSTVVWSMKLVSTSSGRIDSSASKDWAVTVNGTKYSGTNTVGIANNTTKTLASGTTVIKHNADGSKSFSYSFSQEFAITFSGSSIGTISGSGSATLNTIPRASQPSCVTWPNHTQNVGNFGDKISIHMNRNSSTFTHTVRYQFGSQSGAIATNVGTGTTWTIPLSLMNLIPNATKGSGTIYVDTFNGSTKIGTKSCGFTATVPANVKPSCSIDISDAAGLLSTYGAYVKGLSKLKVVITPTLAYKASIKAYSATVDGGKYTAASFTTGVLKSYGTVGVSASVTDARGRTGSASKGVSVLDYSSPSVTRLTVGRCDSNGTANEQGAYVQVTFSANVTALNNKNTASYTLKHKKSGTTAYTEVDLSAIKNTYTVTDHKYTFAADTGSSYDVEVSVADNHSTATRATSASTAFTLMHWNADGTGMGIGKVSEKSNTLEIALDAEFMGKVKGTIFDAIYPVGSIYTAFNHVNPSTLFGGTWQRLQGGFLWASQEGDTIGQTGGEKTVTLTVNQIPAHNHGGTYTNAGSAEKTHAWLASGGSSMAYEAVDAGGGQAHNNMPPYIQVSVWRRTA